MQQEQQPYWDKFTQTGTVLDYIKYKNAENFVNMIQTGQEEQSGEQRHATKHQGNRY